MKKAVFLMTLLANTLAMTQAADAGERLKRWDFTFDGFFSKSATPAPLYLYARAQDGAWLGAVGSSRDPANPQRRTYNTNRYYADLSAAPVKDGGVKGRMILYISPDPWIPSDHRPYSVLIDLDGKTNAAGKIEGSYQVVSLDSKDHTAAQFKGRSGTFTAISKDDPTPATLPPQVTFELRLHAALQGGDPTLGERCMVLSLGFDNGKLVATRIGGLSKKQTVYGLTPVEPMTQSVTCSSQGVKGSMTLQAKTVEMRPAVYTITFDARAVESLLGGTYTAQVTLDKDTAISLQGSFDGSWKEGVEPVQQADTRPWWTPVPGFVPVQAGEHPRLLFRKSDLPALRQRAQTHEGQAMLARLRVLLNGKDGETLPTIFSASGKAYEGKGLEDESGAKVTGGVGAYTISHAAGYGLLYQITGDKKYAELGRQCFEKAFEGVRDRDDRYSWKLSGGPLRTGPTLGWYAVGYDLCYDGWDAATREKIGKAIANFKEEHASNGKKGVIDLETLARGTMPPGSNHYGMQVGGATLAVLAVMDDPGVDRERIRTLLAICENSMVRNLTEGFGDGGFFAEGDGTGSMASIMVFLNALQGWKNAMGRDYANTERPNARMTALKWVYLTVVRGGQPDFWPIRGAYGKNVWARHGLSGGGYFAIGMGAVTDEQKAAMKWYYDHFLAGPDSAAKAPYDTVSPYPHVAVNAFVNWPLGIKERNPAEILPLCYRDTVHGFYAWRNRWQDENDIVISILTRPTEGYMRAGSEDAFRVAAFGKKFNWGHTGGGDTRHWWRSPKGDTSVMTFNNGTSIAVDFTKASGADAMLVTTGPGEGRQVKVGSTSLTFKFLTSGEEPAVSVEGNTAIIGKQRIAIKDGNLAF